MNGNYFTNEKYYPEYYDDCDCSECRTLRVMNCDHEYSPDECETCERLVGGFFCLHCGDSYDGGDHIAGNADYWCQCDEGAKTDG